MTPRSNSSSVYTTNWEPLITSSNFVKSWLPCCHLIPYFELLHHNSFLTFILYCTLFWLVDFSFAALDTASLRPFGPDHAWVSSYLSSGRIWNQSQVPTRASSQLYFTVVPWGRHFFGSAITERSNTSQAVITCPIISRLRGLMISLLCQKMPFLISRSAFLVL